MWHSLVWRVDGFVPKELYDRAASVMTLVTFSIATNAHEGAVIRSHPIVFFPSKNT